MILYNNGLLDADDHGYWTEFEYGKWTDGYSWRTPKEGYNSIYRNDDKESHSYTIGRKQIYYLDAVKTRTHTALFVKEIRADNKSSDINKYNSPWNTGNFNYAVHPKKLSAQKSKKIPNHLTLYNGNGSVSNLNGYNGKQTTYSYINIPSHQTMYLKRIILLKNEDSNYNKSLGAITNNLTGKIFFNKGYSSLVGTGPGYATTVEVYENNPTTTPVKNISMQMHQNVLDVKDIEGINLEGKAQKVIDFNYDYSLAKLSPNSSASNQGRLTLKSVKFNGKQNQDVLPPYKFSYNKSNINFINEDIDIWGYLKDNSDAWSLNKITVPTGGEINITYESDTFKPINNLPLKFVKDMSPYSNSSSTGRLLTEPDSNGEFFIDPRQHIGIKVNDLFDVYYHSHVAGNIYTNPLGTNYKVKVSAKITQHISGTKYKADLLGSIPTVQGTLKSIQAEYKIDKTFEGGGIRTKDITVSNLADHQTKVSYSYEGGVTSYMPLDDYKVYLSTELISPGVMYESVSQSSYDKLNTFKGKTKYNFEVLGPMTIEYFPVQPGGIDLELISKIEYSHLKSTVSQENFFGNPHIYSNDNYAVALKYDIEDKQSSIGRVLSVESYNSLNQIIAKTENNYKTNLDDDGQIGVDQESFKSFYKSTGEDNDEHKYYLTSLSKTYYPNIIENTSEKKLGFTFIKYFDKRDFLTGQVIETRSRNSKGLTFKTKNISAYNKYSGMGSKVDDINNKNMLSQQTASYTYLVDEVANTKKVVNAGITSWNNIWEYRNYSGAKVSPTSDKEKIWRKHKTYLWKGEINDDGTYKDYVMSTDDGFNWGVGANQSNPKWKAISELTLFSKNSFPLETKDINNNYASTKRGDRDSKVLATSNSKYTEMYYSGAEYLNNENTNYFDGEILSTGRNSRKFHMGKYSVKVTSGQQGFSTTLKNGEHRAGKYKISVWVHKDNYLNARIFDGQSLTSFNGEKAFAGEWVLMNHYQNFSINATNVYITSNSGEVHLDDFRIHPITSSMTSYVYNEFDEITFIMGTNGLSTCYVYDKAGKLKETWVEVLDNPEAGIVGGFKKVKTHAYNYKN